MHANGQANGRFDGTLYSENRRNFPVQELQKYAGRWVAFSGDGTRIVDSDTDIHQLCDRLDASGIDAESVVLSQIHADEVGLE